MNIERKIPGFTHAVVDTEDGRVYAGEVFEVVIAGAEFLRVTVPSGQFQFFRGETLAAITPCTPAFAAVAGAAFHQPLDHIHIPEARGTMSAAGGGATMEEDEAVYQNGYEDGLAAGYDQAMEEYAEQRAFEEAESSLEKEAAVNRERERQGLLLPGDDGFPDMVPEFLREDAA